MRNHSHSVAVSTSERDFCDPNSPKEQSSIPRGVARQHDTMASLFRGRAQAQHYAASRPTYPAILYEKILSRISSEAALASPRICVDVGCGTGQATVAMVEHFDEIIGIDPSTTQLSQATKHDKVKYVLGTVEERLAEVEENSVSCITSAQAAHWLEIPAFYNETRRVLKPGGVVALWTYGLNYLPQNRSVQTKLEHLYHGALGDEYWDSRRKLVENNYRDIPLLSETFPEEFEGERLASEDLNIVQELSGSQLVRYLRSWSGYNSYCNRNNVTVGSPEDPILPIEEEVANEQSILSIWPVTMLIAAKKDS